MPTAVGIVADSYNKPAAGGWTPIDLGAALWGWWDATDSATITAPTGGAVSQWNDKSPNARHVTQPTLSFRPVTGTRTINGLNGFDFFPTPNYTFLTLTPVTLPQPFTFVAVAQYDDVDTAARNTVCGAPALYFRTNAGNWNMNAGTALIGSADDALPHVLVGIFNGATSEYRKDGTSMIVGNAGTSGISAAAFNIGRNQASTTWDGIIGEVVVTNTALSGADLTALESYLRTKWGTL